MLLAVEKVFPGGVLETILWLVQFGLYRAFFDGLAPLAQALVSVRRDEVDLALLTAFSVARQCCLSPRLALLTDSEV